MPINVKIKAPLDTIFITETLRLKVEKILVIKYVISNTCKRVHRVNE